MTISLFRKDICVAYHPDANIYNAKLLIDGAAQKLKITGFRDSPGEIKVAFQAPLGKVFLYNVNPHYLIFSMFQLNTSLPTTEYAFQKL